MKNSFAHYCLLFLLVSVGCTDHTDQISTIRIEDLRTDYLENPLGIENDLPTFSWKLISSQKGQFQTAYQILVASSSGNLEKEIGDMWSTGKVTLGRSVQVNYEGKKVESGQRYFWKIKVWDEKGFPSNFSETYWFETGKLRPDDWEAGWISQQPDSTGIPVLLPAPYFRKEFELTERILKARLYISGLGYYKTFINGRKVGDHELDPAFSRYDRRVKYVVYDIGDLLKHGDNCIGVVLGNGWYNQHTRSAWDLDSASWRDNPSLLAQVELFYSDGTRKIIKTDKSWKIGHGPIVFDGIRNGEHYDARKMIQGWNEVGFDDTAWNQSFEVKGPAGRLSSQVMPPIRIIRKVEFIEMNEPEPGIFVLNYGENIAGRIRMSIRGKEGQEITIRYGERIHPDGTLDQTELARFIWTGETQTDRYICNGVEEETWESSFVYHGFQYVQIEGLRSPPEKEQISAIVLHTDFKPTGFFQCSNEMFTQLQRNLLNSFLGNYHGYPTDCPHREKIGWSGDAQLVSATGLYNFQMIPAYLKWMDDFADEQRSDGKVPAIIPTGGWGYTFGRGRAREHGYGPHWDGAYLNIPWDMYLFSGDLEILKRYFGGWKAYMTYLEQSANHYILDYGIDDHKPVTTITAGYILSTGYFFDFSRKMSRISALLGKEEEKEHYNELARKIFHAFNDRFYDQKNAVYGNGGQTSMSMALYLGLVPEDQRDRVIRNLLEEIHKKNEHIDAGVVGTRLMIKALTELGYPDVLYQIVNQQDYPGWGYWIENGATTLWQTWDGSMSLNHIMFGSIGEWFYNTLGGIRMDPHNPGFKKFFLKPACNDSLDWVNCHFESPYGRIVSNWKKKEGIFTWNIKVPVNTKASAFIPVRYDSKIYESGEELSNSPFLDILEKTEQYWLIELGSGNYEFEVR